MQHIVNYLHTQYEQFLTDLATLVNRDCGTHNKTGVDMAGALMGRFLAEQGLAVTTLPLQEYGDCLVGRLTGRGQARIMLIGHLDTVYPDGTAATRLMRIEQGHVLGPGVCDMKAGLLVGVYALRALRHIGFDDFAEIVFFCNSDEEVGSPVSQKLYADMARQADAVLVLEAARANGAIVSGRKGGGVYHLTVQGRAAHAGVEPEKGANAILALSHYIQVLHALNQIRPGITLNVGVVWGGTVSNVVPAYAEATIDVRVSRREDIALLDAIIREEIGKVHVPGTTARITGKIETLPMEKTPATAFLADLARQRAADLGFALEDVTTGGTSDANFVAALGTPVLDGLGPVGGLDHSPGEYIELESIVPRTALLAGLMMSITQERDRLLTFGRPS